MRYFGVGVGVGVGGGSSEGPQMSPLQGLVRVGHESQGSAMLDRLRGLAAFTNFRARRCTIARAIELPRPFQGTTVLIDAKIPSDVRGQCHPDMPRRGSGPALACMMTWQLTCRRNSHWPGWVVGRARTLPTLPQFRRTNPAKTKGGLVLTT